jgi:hypothetical protein
MKLEPKRPPGRPNRKALLFEAEIARLRSEGYPCVAIWEALLDAGLSLSLSAVKREVARLRKRADATFRNAAPLVATRLQVSNPHALMPPRASTSPTLSSKDMAIAWMESQETNPLVRERIAHESGRH